MSKFFNRIGTKATKFSFEAEIEFVKLKLEVGINFSVIWKRGISE